MANLEHKDIPDADLHEPKGVASAAVEQVYVADGAGSGAWQAQETAELFEQTADQTVANTTTETTIGGPGEGSTTIPSTLLKFPQHFLLRAQGIVSNTATPTINIRFKLNGVTFASTGAQTLGSVSNDHWSAFIDFLIRSEGSTGTVMVTGGFLTSNNDHFAMINTAVQTIDTTIDQTFDITAEWGTASASNTITSQICDLRIT